MERTYFVYIMASQRNGTLYTGVTNDIARRVWEHRENLGSQFVQMHGAKRLVWYDTFDDISYAIAAEKRIKRWKRVWKLEMIEKMNPQWLDLYETLI